MLKCFSISLSQCLIASLPSFLPNSIFLHELSVFHLSLTICQYFCHTPDTEKACQQGFAQHLEHLLFYGADISSQNASGNTALHISALYNKVCYRKRMPYEISRVVTESFLNVFTFSG